MSPHLVIITSNSKIFRTDCPNGKLTRAHLRNLVRQLFPEGNLYLGRNKNLIFSHSGNAENFVKHILRVFDTDGNDFLDFKEFLMAMDICNCQTSKADYPWCCIRVGCSSGKAELGFQAL